ncbi:MAG: CHAP domain-containing protein [Lactovum sp.]
MIVLSAASPSMQVKADSTEDQIANQNQIIEEAQSSAATAKAAADDLQKKVDEANARIDKLTSESEKMSKQITQLNEDIRLRDESLKSQARSAQTDGGATSYINAVLNASSLTDVVQKVTAMSQVVSANNAMMKQQQEDEKSIQKKLEENQKAYEEVSELQRQLAVQSVQLEAAQLSYQATIATAEGEKSALIAQKEEAQARAAEIAAAQEAAKNSTIQNNNNSSNSNSNSGNSNSNSNSGNSNSGSSNSGSSSSGGGSSISVPEGSLSNPFPWGQCTWGVYQILGGNMPIYRGNAADWAVYSNTSGPTPGAIAVFGPGVQGAGGVGHVAVVSSVNSNGTFNIQETNYNGNPNITTRSNLSTSGVSFIIP